MVSVHHVARRTLTANVTATLGVDVPDGATGACPQLCAALATSPPCHAPQRPARSAANPALPPQPRAAADEDISAALEVQRLSADDPIDMLSSDPDRFFGRTTKVCWVRCVQLAG